MAIGTPTIEQPPQNFVQGSKTTNAGTAAALGTTAPIRGVFVVAKVANTGYVYVGNASVSSSAYMKRLSAGESVFITINDLAKVYIDVSVNAEGVTFGYLSDTQ